MLNKNKQKEVLKALESLPEEMKNALLDILSGKKIEKDEEPEKTWKDDLAIDNKGNYKPFIKNYKLWLLNESKYAGKLKYNEFFDFIEYDGKIIKDIEEKYIAEAAEEFFNHNISRINLQTAVETYANDNKYNPIVEYLDSLKGKWDGVKRLETFIIDTLDADDTPLNRFFSKKWMIAAVKRAYIPGCQFDCVLALQGGKQGSGKSTLFRRLGLDNYYKTFGSGEFKSKDCIDKMNKSWISVLDEFDKFSDKEVADLKCKITERTMACRKCWGHNTEDFKVHWVYAATTNANDFLCDLTGDEYERRYWIIECNKTTEDSRVHDTLTDEYVNQLWAEAVNCYFEDPNQQLYLASDNPLYEDYKKYQRKFKKTAHNTTIDYINEILEANYVYADKKDGCDTTIDMYDQFTGKVQLDYRMHRKINKVPCGFVQHILNKVYGINYQPRYIKSMLIQDGNKWTLKETGVRYNGKNISNILVRTVPIKADDKKDETNNNEIPF